MAEKKNLLVTRDGKIDRKEGTALAAGGTAATAGVALGTKIPEHSHYDKKTRKYIAGLPAGVHEVDTEKLKKKPRKLGARKQQREYVATMAKERPEASFKSSPVPITRYKDGVIQRDNAHSVMANAMKGRKTTVKIEDADGYKPRRRTGEEVVRRAQSRYQQGRLKRNFNLGDKEIERVASKYKKKSREANTAKRPHGVVEEGFKQEKKPYGPGQALARPNLEAAKKLVRTATMAKRDNRDRNVAAGATGAAGVGALASTPVRRSAAKVDIKNGQMSASDAKKIANPGYRPGNQRAIQVMARNLGHLENKPSAVVQYKDGTAIPWDGNHRATARIARGDKSIPVERIQGGERPTVSAARNAYHSVGRRMNARNLDKGKFTPTEKTGKHSGQTKSYKTIANASPGRSSGSYDPSTIKSVAGPSAKMLRGKQAAFVGGGLTLLGAGATMSQKDKKPVKKNLTGHDAFGIE